MGQWPPEGLLGRVVLTPPKANGGMKLTSSSAKALERMMDQSDEHLQLKPIRLKSFSAYETIWYKTSKPNDTSQHSQTSVAEIFFILPKQFH